MDFKPVQNLHVQRRLSTGNIVSVGQLAQNHQGIFFQYDPQYLTQYGNLSPFSLESSNTLQLAPKTPHGGLHGLFSDSLPDGWGLLLQDKIFRQHDILPTQITPLDRLAFIGQRGMGAFSFTPESDLQHLDQNSLDIATLGLEAQALFDGQTEDVLSALVAAGSSGGARPKAQIYLTADDWKNCRTTPEQGDDAWLVKFTSANLALGHAEGLCEATYLQLAHMAGLEPPQWKLIDAPAKSGAPAWLAVKRFDWMDNGNKVDSGRLHMHSACGLLDADFRAPSLDYADLIKASRQLCKSPSAGQLQFRRAIFNLFACNQDDHSKNWAFLQNDQGLWTPAPFYDITFSPHPFNQHATSFSGYGNTPPLKVIQKLATTAGFASWNQAQQHIHEIIDVLASFADTAKDHHVNNNTAKLISKQLESIRQENKGLV
jgi:serine/threonine-protein kinase HipA